MPATVKFAASTATKYFSLVLDPRFSDPASKLGQKEFSILLSRRVYTPQFFVSSQQKFGVTDIKAPWRVTALGGQTVLRLSGLERSVL